MQTVAATVESSREIPQKTKNGTALGPSNSTFGNISEEIQNTNSKRFMNSCIHYNVIYNSQDMEATQEPINKRCGTYVQWDITQL